MQVILQGSLRHFPAAELLAFLCNHARKGTLDVEAQGRRTRILFADDAIVWAESRNVPDAVDAILDVFSWDAGSFTLLDAFELPPYAKPLGLTLAALHEEARSRADAGPYRDDTVFRVVDSPAQQQVSLTGDEFKILFRLATGRTLAELVTELGLDRKELSERLQKLEELGLVRSGSEEAAAPAASSPAPVPPPAPAPAPQAAPAPEAAPIPENPFAPKTDPVPVQEDPEATRIERVTPQQRVATIAQQSTPRRKTMVGSLTPDDAPDSVHPLLDDECIIGRAPGNGITIPDGSVSSRHARIVRSDDGFTIEDLQSRNGTFVNGEKVEKPRLLADGDLVRVGKIIMIFNLARESAPVETTQPEIKL